MALAEKEPGVCVLCMYVMALAEKELRCVFVLCMYVMALDEKELRCVCIVYVRHGPRRKGAQVCVCVVYVEGAEVCQNVKRDLIHSQKRPTIS
jgi:hypothetical protein